MSRLAALVLLPVWLFGCDDAPAADVPPNVSLALRDTAATNDDMLRVGETAPLALHADAAATVTLSVNGIGTATVEPSIITVGPAPTSVVVRGVSASAVEGDTQLEARIGDRLVASLPITIVTGVAIHFSGTFGFAVDNNNGAAAVGMTCAGVSDPPVWRTTPLPCEGLEVTYNQLYFSEGERPERWSLASGKRPAIEVRVSAIRSFGPTVDLAGRDTAIDVGAVVASSGEAVATMVTDDCDGDPNTGEPDGSDQGSEAVLGLDVAVGDALTATYAGEPARIWTRFPAPPTAAEISEDVADVAMLFPAGRSGCSDVLTFLDGEGVLHCEEAHSVSDLLARHVGFRSAVRRAWANFTSRGLVVTPTGASWIAAMLGSDAEIFMQLSGYDWYTLVGRVDKGLIASPGAIPPAFVEWPTTGCPEPQEPDVERDDQPLPQ